MPRIRGVQPEVQQTAKILRRQPTKAEDILWQSLRNRQLEGVKFRRQQPLGNVIVDFVSPEHHLVIEADGPIHDNRTEDDAERTAHLNAYGYKVIRFKNEEVLNNLQSVLYQIRQELRIREGL